jgi:hypothetical protein
MIHLENDSLDLFIATKILITINRPVYIHVMHPLPFYADKSPPRFECKYGDRGLPKLFGALDLTRLWSEQVRYYHGVGASFFEWRRPHRRIVLCNN